MIERHLIEHYIQKHIMGVLLYQKYAKFSQLRPPRVDTNLFSYHLKVLLKSDFVAKSDDGYTLSLKGLEYVDRVSTTQKFTLRSQPKIITMLVVQNSEGDILLQRRTKQPYIDTWTLPYGKLHIDDVSVVAAARREAYEKLGLSDVPVEHAGDCYIRTQQDEDTIMATLAHVFRFETDAVTPSDTLLWARPHKLTQLALAPAVEEIMTRTFFRDRFFFEEYTVEAAF